MVKFIALSPISFCIQVSQISSGAMTWYHIFKVILYFKEIIWLFFRIFVEFSSNFLGSFKKNLVQSVFLLCLNLLLSIKLICAFKSQRFLVVRWFDVKVLTWYLFLKKICNFPSEFFRIFIKFFRFFLKETWFNPFSLHVQIYYSVSY